ncbi:MAG: S8 family peptidase, partial [Desulfovibrionales bacterium]
MKWHIAFYLAGTLLLFHAGAALGKPLQGEYVPGELLIKYKQGRSSTAEQSRGGGRLQSMRRVHRFGIEHVKVPSGMSMEEAVRLLEKDPNVDFVEPNYIRRRTAVPNDLLFGLQWALSNTGQTVNKVAGTVDADIDAVEAWDREIGNSDIVVAVLDTGIDWRHPDLKENIRINSGDETPDGVDDDANGFIDDFRGWDFVDGDNDPMDLNGHGTHVAGTLGSDGNNAIGTAGVAWKVGLMPLRFLDVYGVGTVADEIEAIDYAIQKGVRIINASYGGAQYSQSEFDALARAQKAGILVVAAAGNASRNNDTIPEYPASYSASQKPDDTTVLHNIIAVAASTQDDTLASFSSFGAVSVDVAAPGVNVAATMSEPPVAFEDFENDISGWSLESPWAVTAARGHGISNRSLADSPVGNYTNGLDIVAESPTIELEGQTGLVLTFFLRGESEQPDGEKEGDRLFVET